MLPHPLAASRGGLKPSVTEVRMSPYDRMRSQDGHGYGRSMNWHYQAINCSEKTGEQCEHFKKFSPDFQIENVLIKMSPIEEGLDDKIRFRVSCNQCQAVYILTSAKLTKKFLKFYGL